jgi:hypothetical protein
MRILKHSLLLFRINPNKDTVKCFFLFRINLFTYKIERLDFDLKKTPLSVVLQFHENLANEWTGMYRV